MNDTAIVRALCRWFGSSARDLPWRRLGPPGDRDLYACLVSELMLQQTQVSRVAERFGLFMERFPTPDALARADEDDVLAMWSGLGYYRRARLLRQAAAVVVERFGGRMPSDVEALLSLPGIGRYTAGAIASIGAGRAAPIVDGNVARVLLRLEGEALDPSATPTQKLLWTRSEELVRRAARSRAGGVSAGMFNEAMMELGAVVCTPRNPACVSCPLSSGCRARESGRQHEIPRAKQKPARSDVFCASVLIEDGSGRFAVEQRPGKGMWASLWQAPTIESDKAHPEPSDLERAFGADRLDMIGEFTHKTTHRDVHFRVYRAHGAARVRGTMRSPAEIGSLALSSPQRRVLLETDTLGV